MFKNRKFTVRKTPMWLIDCTGKMLGKWLIHGAKCDIIARDRNGKPKRWQVVVSMETPPAFVEISKLGHEIEYQLYPRVSLILAAKLRWALAWSRPA